MSGPCLMWTRPGPRHLGPRQDTSYVRIPRTLKQTFLLENSRLIKVKINRGICFVRKLCGRRIFVGPEKVTLTSFKRFSKPRTFNPEQIFKSISGYTLSLRKYCNLHLM